ncbi:MAG: helix-turn-helix domain-containing protein [Tannerellaceae bacterium]
MQTIYIKNMVCDRCVMVVRDIFARLSIEVAHVVLGEVEVPDTLTAEQVKQLTSQLEAVGFEVIDNRRSKLIEQIKNYIRDLVYRQEGVLKVNLSDYLAAQLHLDYPYLTTLFSEAEGTTIEKYYIAQKIERVKELLVYDDLSLSEIAHRLNYSSTAHLSSQFKKVTGLTPTFYKQLADKRRKPIDKI